MLGKMDQETFYLFALASIHYMPEPAEITKIKRANKICPFPFSVPSEGCVRCGNAEAASPHSSCGMQISMVIPLTCWAFTGVSRAPSRCELQSLTAYPVSRITQGSWRINFMANPVRDRSQFGADVPGGGMDCVSTRPLFLGRWNSFFKRRTNNVTQLNSCHNCDCSFLLSLLG